MSGRAVKYDRYDTLAFNPRGMGIERDGFVDIIAKELQNGNYDAVLQLVNDHEQRLSQLLYHFEILFGSFGDVIKAIQQLPSPQMIADDVKNMKIKPYVQQYGGRRKRYNY